MPTRATEDHCEDTIIEAAGRGGWRVHAERAARTAAGHRTPVKGDPGWPDLVLAHDRRGAFLVVELKRHPNTVEPAQHRWLDTLDAAGVMALVWWVPEQLDDIVEYLLDHRRRYPPAGDARTWKDRTP